MLTDQTSLITENLNVGYKAGHGSTLLFEGLSISLKKGCLTCFMGPNGIGKSTLIKTLAGLHAPLSGKTPPLTEKEVALVLTDKIQAANMRVIDLVSYGRYPHTDWSVTLSTQDHSLIQSAMMDAQISHLTERNLTELSDGQLQMALIARALAQQTPIMLLDEPTAHLDLNNRMEIMNLLRRLAHDQGKSILIATHELDLALQMADEVWLAMPDKKIITGIPEDLVLDGSFDTVFKWKGFDLKTGKVKHVAYRDTPIQLTGEGSEFLWTKNALEREGFLVTTEGTPVELISHQGIFQWKIDSEIFPSLNQLLRKLTKV